MIFVYLQTLQLTPGSYTREKKKLSSTDGSRREQHLLGCLYYFLLTILLKYHTSRFTALEYDLKNSQKYNNCVILSLLFCRQLYMYLNTIFEFTTRRTILCKMTWIPNTTEYPKTYLIPDCSVSLDTSLPIQC